MIQKQKIVHKLFQASVLIKAVNGVWETISGLGILALSRVTIAHAFYDITKHNLSNNTRDFAGVYILSHGLINLFLAYYLYKQKLWAFWVSVAFFSGSVVYLCFKASQSHSPFIYALIAFDLLFIYLTVHEYNYRKNQKNLAVA